MHLGFQIYLHGVVPTNPLFYFKFPILMVISPLSYFIWMYTVFFFQFLEIGWASSFSLFLIFISRTRFLIYYFYFPITNQLISVFILIHAFLLSSFTLLLISPVYFDAQFIFSIFCFDFYLYRYICYESSQVLFQLHPID